MLGGMVMADTISWVMTSLLLLVLVLVTTCNSQDRYGRQFKPPPRAPEASVVAYLKQKSEYYGQATRPILNVSEPMVINMTLSLIQVDVNEPLNTLTTSVWVKYRWYDKFMTWNKTDFDEVDVVVIPSDWVWQPKLSLVNTAEIDVKAREADLLIYSTGGIYWLSHKVYRSACLFDVTDYPFDQHTCHLWFQSISYPSYRLSPNTTEFSLETYLTDFRKADEWEIIGNKSERISKPKDKGEGLVFSERVALRFSLTLKRRAGFQAYLLTLPCVVLGSLSVLVFSLPPERPDRHALATSLLGSFIMLLLVLVSTAPPSAASIPKLGLFYAFNICIIVLSLCLSAIVINVSKLGDKGCKVPKIIDKIVLDYLATLLLMKVCRPQADKAVNTSSDGGEEGTGAGDKLPASLSLSNGKLARLAEPEESDELLSRRRRSSGTEEADAIVANNTSGTVTDTTTSAPTGGEHKQHNNTAILLVGQSLSRIIVTLRAIETLIERVVCRAGSSPGLLRQTEEQIKWKAVGAVMDRFFMVTYIVIICISLTFLLPRAHTM